MAKASKKKPLYVFLKDEVINDFAGKNAQSLYRFIVSFSRFAYQTISKGKPEMKTLFLLFFFLYLHLFLVKK